MRSSRQGAIPSELGALIDELDETQRRLRILEAPSGEALGNTVAKLGDTVAKLSALIANIQAQLDAWAAGRRTDAQTDAIIDAKIAAAIAAVLGGNVQIGGSLQVAGGATVNGAVTMPDVFNTDIGSLGGARQTVWVREGGRIGHT